MLEVAAGKPRRPVQSYCAPGRIRVPDGPLRVKNARARAARAPFRHVPVWGRFRERFRNRALFGVPARRHRLSELLWGHFLSRGCRGRGLGGLKRLQRHVSKLVFRMGGGGGILNTNPKHRALQRGVGGRAGTLFCAGRDELTKQMSPEAKELRRSAQ